MRKVNNKTQRILWLIYTELRYKLSAISLFFLICFALLIFYYWNPSFQITGLINELIGNGNTTRIISGTTYTSNGVTYTTSSGINTINLKYHIEYFSIAFFGLGLAINSLLFSEYGEEKSKRFHITVPASVHEKWLAKLIISLIAYPILFLLLYQFFAQLTYQWSSLRGFDLVKLNLLDPLLWRYVVIYFLAGAFFIGIATYFRQRALLKISLYMIIGYFGVGIVLSLLSLILFPSFDSSKMIGYFSLTGYQNFVYANGFIFNKDYIEIRDIVFHPAFYVILAIVSLGFSYLKFNELEA